MSVLLLLAMIKRVRDSYKHNFAIIAFGPFLKIIEAIFDLLIPLIMKAVIDLRSGKEPTGLSAFVRTFNPSGKSLGDVIAGGSIILIMGVVGYIITMVSQYLAARASVNVGTEVRCALYRKAVSLSKDEREKIGNARLLTLINSDTYQLQHGVLLFVRLVVRAPFILIGSLIISFILNWKIGLAFLAIVPMILLVNYLVLKRSSKKYVSIQSDLDSISKTTSETSEGARVIRASNQQEQENIKFETKTSSYEEKSVKVNKLNSLINPLTFAITSIVLIVIILLLQDNLFSGDIAIASIIIAEMAYLSQIFFVVVQLSQVAVEIVKAGVSRKRIDQVLMVEPKIVNSDSPKTGTIKDGEELIKFKGVSFSFSGDNNYFLDDLNFEIRKGETLGIIGGTGSGKSTIVNLIERFYDTTEGTILYKGIPLKEYDLNALRKDIGLVNQKSSLFNGSIKDNFLMSNKEANEEEIIESLKLAEAYEFVSKYEDGLEHQIKEGGTNLSGGQKQRLCIARALVKKPELLILDDSTSALDLLTDKKIRTNVSNIKDMTKVIISQRVSTIQNADFIIVLEGGKVVGQGKHNDLLDNCPIYREIYDTQVKKG